MSKLGEAILVMLNGLVPDTNRAQLSAKSEPLSYLQFHQGRSRGSFASFGDITLAAKDVLDVGCGLGANLDHICALGARRVIGLDIDAHQIQCTRSMIEIHYPGIAPRLQFAAGDAAEMPFGDASFDALVSADAFEHVGSLEGTLRECARVLKLGGYLYAYFHPFYAPWGAHMINWIRLPWCQLVFSESTIVNAARRIEREGRSANSRLPPETSLDLLDGDAIPFVSHLTLDQFRHVLRQLPAWRVVRRRFLPPGWRSGGWVSRVLRPFTWFPVIQEMFTARAVFVLQKVQAG